MNYQQTLDEMLRAASGAAKGHWETLRRDAELEFRRLSEAALGLEVDYVSDIVAAAEETLPEKRVEAERRAKRRLELAFESLKLAAESMVIAARQDARIPAQNAVNAAVAVLRRAINVSIAIDLL